MKDKVTVAGMTFHSSSNLSSSLTSYSSSTVAWSLPVTSLPIAITALRVASAATINKGECRGRGGLRRLDLPKGGMRVVELFSGIGGMILGLETGLAACRAVYGASSATSESTAPCRFTIQKVRAYEISEHANGIYRYNFMSNDKVKKNFASDTSSKSFTKNNARMKSQNDPRESPAKVYRKARNDGSSYCTSNSGGCRDPEDSLIAAAKAVATSLTHGIFYKSCPF